MVLQKKEDGRVLWWCEDCVCLDFWHVNHRRRLRRRLDAIGGELHLAVFTLILVTCHRHRLSHSQRSALCGHCSLHNQCRECFKDLDNRSCL